MKLDGNKLNTYTDDGLLPAGTYQARVKAIDEDYSNGTALILTWSVTDGSHAGMTFKDRFFLEHRNPVCEKLAHKRLHQLQVALGIERLDDSDQLLNRSATVVVKHTTSDNDPNVVFVNVSKYAPSESGATSQPASTPPATSFRARPQYRPQQPSVLRAPQGWQPNGEASNQPQPVMTAVEGRPDEDLPF